MYRVQGRKLHPSSPRGLRVLGLGLGHGHRRQRHRRLNHDWRRAEHARLRSAAPVVHRLGNRGASVSMTGNNAGFKSRAQPAHSDRALRAVDRSAIWRASREDGNSTGLKFQGRARIPSRTRARVNPSAWRASNEDGHRYEFKFPGSKPVPIRTRAPGFTPRPGGRQARMGIAPGSNSSSSQLLPSGTRAPGSSPRPREQGHRVLLTRQGKHAEFSLFLLTPSKIPILLGRRGLTSGCCRPSHARFARASGRQTRMAFLRHDAVHRSCLPSGKE
jgi:hypothetical protein